MVVLASGLDKSPTSLAFERRTSCPVLSCPSLLFSRWISETDSLFLRRRRRRRRRRDKLLWQFRWGKGRTTEKK